MSLVAQNLSKFQQLALITGLHSLLTAEYFSVIDFKALVKLGGFSVEPLDMTSFEALHCVHYNAMHPEMKEELYLTLAKVFQLQRENLNPPKEASKPRQSNWLMRLLK
jgi:hypothetical protein